MLLGTCVSECLVQVSSSLLLTQFLVNVCPRRQEAVAKAVESLRYIWETQIRLLAPVFDWYSSGCFKLIEKCVCVCVKSVCLPFK